MLWSSLCYLLTVHSEVYESHHIFIKPYLGVGGMLKFQTISCSRHFLNDLIMNFDTYQIVFEVIMCHRSRVCSSHSGYCVLPPNKMKWLHTWTSIATLNMTFLHYIFEIPAMDSTQYYRSTYIFNNMDIKYICEGKGGRGDNMCTKEVKQYLLHSWL